MKAFRKAAGMFLVVYAIIYSVLFMTYPLFEDTSAMWSILNWVTGFAILLILAAVICAKVALAKKGDQASAVTWIRTNVPVFTSLLLAMWFYSNWSRTALGHDGVEFWWGLIGPLFAIHAGAIGSKMLGGKKAGDSVRNS